MYARALAIHERALGPGHTEVAVYLQHFARWHDATGDFDGARRLHERALAICAEEDGRDTAEFAIGVSNFAVSRRAAGDEGEALALYRQVIALREAHLDRDHPLLARSLVDVAQLEHGLGRPELAVPLLERAVAIYGHREGIGEDEFDAAFALARGLVATGGDRERARRLALQAREGHRDGRRRSTAVPEIDAWLAVELAQRDP